MSLRRRPIAACMRLVIPALLCLLTVSPGLAATELPRGAYLARIMDCGGCHTPGAFAGKPDPSRYLGGGDVGFAVPDLGVFFPPNLTSDAETGLGTWSEGDIVAAVRQGIRPDGRVLAPAMPWHAYAALTDADAAALAAYIRSLPATPNRVPGPFGPGEPVLAPYLTVVVPSTQ